jgi:hypothetical protein
MGRGAVCAAVLYFVLLAPRFARAEEAARERARALATEGDQLFARGRCDQAIALWTEADAAYHAPTIVLRIGRCEALLGRVVQAAATLESIVSEGTSAMDGDAFRLAREDAARELPVIRARIARLVIEVEGAGAADAPPVRAEIDGHPVEIGTAAAVDPGHHELRVMAGSGTWSQREKVADGEARSVRVRLLTHATPETRSGSRAMGYVLGGAGAAGMAVGAGFGAASVALSHTLFGVCGPAGNACPPSQKGQIETLSRDTLVSDLALGTGAALFVIGAVVVLAENGTHTERPLQFDLVGSGVSVHGGF